MKSNKIHNYQNTVKCAYYKFTTKTIPLLEIDNYIILSFEKKTLHVLDLFVYLQIF